MDNPMADSAAATTKTYKANIWPIILSKNAENTIKSKLIANNINSIDISIIIIFFLLTTIPKIPIRNKSIAKVG